MLAPDFEQVSSMRGHLSVDPQEDCDKRGSLDCDIVGVFCITGYPQGSWTGKSDNDTTLRHIEVIWNS